MMNTEGTRIVESLRVVSRAEHFEALGWEVVAGGGKSFGTE